MDNTRREYCTHPHEEVYKSSGSGTYWCRKCNAQVPSSSFTSSYSGGRFENTPITTPTVDSTSFYGPRPKTSTMPFLLQSDEVTIPGKEATARHTLTYITAVRLVKVGFRIPAAWLITDFRIANRLYIIDGDRIPARMYQDLFSNFSSETVKMGSIVSISGTNVGKHKHQLTALFTGLCVHE